jgi:inner membrane protein
MDPLAHTLVGAALAETRLGRRSMAGAAAILGANAPDVDFVASVGGSDAALYWRRGHTHGVLAMLVLPVLVTAIVLAWDRMVRRRRRPEAEPARAGPLLLLSSLAVLTHPILDWMNTYGVRLLMPFDGRWFYGDAFFIVEPWLWLLAASAVVLARSRGRLSAAGWIVLACAATALVIGTDMAPLGARIGWGVGLALLVGLRLSGRLTHRVPVVAAATLAIVGVYGAGMVAGSRVARAETQAWLDTQGIAATVIMAGPMPADPFARDVIALSADRYHFVERRWLSEPGFRASGDPVPAPREDEVVRAALAAPAVRGLRNWLRFPSFRVEETAAGYDVTILDVRYSRRAGRLGRVVVRLDRSLRPR